MEREEKKMLRQKYRKAVSILCIISMLIIPAGPVYAEGSSTMSTDMETRVYVSPENNGPQHFGDYSAAVALSEENYDKADYRCSMEMKVSENSNLLYVLKYKDDEHYAIIYYENEIWDYEYVDGKNSHLASFDNRMPMVFDGSHITLTAVYTQDGIDVTIRNEKGDYEFTQTITDSGFLKAASINGKTGYGIGYDYYGGETVPEAYFSGFTVSNHKYTPEELMNMSWYKDKEPVWGLDHLAISEANFPDDNLRNLLLNGKSPKKVKYDTDSDGYFSYSEIQNMDGLIASERNISDATGIDFLRGLKALNLVGNNLTEFGYGHPNKGLNSLYISDNQLGSLDLSGLPGLTSLNCSKNKLTALDISGNPELTRVFANHNNISYIDASQNPKLEKLFYVPDRIRMNQRENFALANVNSFPEFVEYYDSVQSDTKEIITDHLVYDKENGTVSLEDTYMEGTLTFSVNNSPETFTFYIEPDGVVINQGNFPDPAFREYVNQFDTDKDGALSETETDAVTKIKVYEEDITNLKGIEYFRKLESLYCRGNKLDTLDLSGLTELKELDCGYNNLKTVDFSSNKKLESLACSDNTLETLDLSGLTELKKLDCGYNKLKSVDFSSNKKLESLELTNNPLESIDTKQTPELVILNIVETRVKEVDLTKLPRLSELYAYRTEIKEVDLSKNPELSNLNVGATKVTELDISNNEKLDKIYCEMNHLTELDVSNNTKLKILYCGRNNLTELDVSNNTKLEAIYCEMNHLTELDLSANKKLEEAYIFGNKIPYEALGDTVENLYCIPEDVKLEKRTGNSWDSIPGLKKLYSRFSWEAGFTWETDHLIFDEKNKVISIEDGYDSGSVTIIDNDDNSVIGGPFTFYYGEPDIDVSLSSAFTKVNDTTYKYAANGNHINAKPIVKDKKGNVLEADKDYFTKYNFNRRVNAGKYTIDVYGTGKHYGKKTINLILTPAAPEKVSARLSRASGGYDDAYISWSASPRASGYQIYARRPSKSSTWSYIGRTTKTSFLEKNLYDGWKYEFKVVPYIVRDDLRYLSTKYRTASVTTLKKVTLTSVGKYNSSKVRVRWKNIASESGYEISRSTSKTGTYIVSKFSTTSGTSRLVSATRNKSYYYKIRAYKVVEGKKVYAPWSSVKYYKLR